MLNSGSARCFLVSWKHVDYLVILSVIVLLAAPLLAKLAERVPPFKGGIDGFVLMTVLGLVVLTLLPEAVEHGGVYGILIALLGFLLPWMSEMAFHKTEEITHRVVMLVAALGLVVHAAGDGALLAFARDSAHGPFLATGILLHRVGVAIAVWWLLRPILTTWGGIAVLGSLGAVTLVGYFMVLFAGEWYSLPLAGYWQAFAAGSLLHVVLHPLGHHDASPAPQTAIAHRFGTALGVVFVGALIASHYFDHGTLAHADGVHVHDVSHIVDLLMMTGGLVAPLCLLLMVCFAVYGQFNGGLGQAYRQLRAISPWTLATWLVVSLAINIWPSLLPMPGEAGVLFYLWMIIVIPVLIHTGARSFFSALLPQTLLHSHDH